MCDLYEPMDRSPPGSPVHGSPGKNTGVSCHALPQGIFPAQGLNARHLVGRSLPLATWEAFQKEEILQMNLEDIILSEIRQSRKTNIA